MMIILAHISDLHLDGTDRAADRATAVMNELRGRPRPIDALLVTGDIADTGAISQYSAAGRILAAPFPVLTCPGNHDVRAAYRTALLNEPATDTAINRVHRVGGIAVLMCDSSVPGRDEGRLEPETLTWLAETLDGLVGVPSVIALHHSPVRLHQPKHDAIMLQDEDDLAGVLLRYPDVVAVLVGHAHAAAASTFAGRPLLVAPGVASTLRLPWESAWDPEHQVDLDQPPGVAYHVVDEQGGLITHFRVVSDAGHGVRSAEM